MFLSLCHVVPRWVLQLAALRVRSDDFKEVEIVVLRHELAVLRRRIHRPAMTWTDRLFLAVASRLLPRARWRSFCVTPATLQVDPRGDGTKPVEFERDRTRAEELIQRFVLPETRCGRHPGFGAMTRDEWLLWGYEHVDHHLRQSGLELSFARASPDLARLRAETVA